MEKQSCVFCDIINKTVPANIIDESDEHIVIEDIAPKAPVHYLIIPKKHVINLKHMQTKDLHMMSSIATVAKNLAKKLPDPGAFTLVMNNGHAAGQTVDHIHCHFLSGANVTGL